MNDVPEAGDRVKRTVQLPGGSPMPGQMGGKTSEQSAGTNDPVPLEDQLTIPAGEGKQ